MNVRSLWIDLRGSVAVEFSIISVVLLIFMFFVADLVLRQATVGKLDRLSYSIAGVLRERIQLYDRREELSSKDVGEVYQLAQRMMQDMNPTADVSALKIRVQQLFFEPRVDLTDNKKYPISKEEWLSHIKGNECQPPKPLVELQDLSPRGSYGRWVPLYQVTLCLPTNSWYTRLTSGGSGQPLVASSAVVMLR
ncbi:tight adherence pilus pseudopilin TadF [Enterobacter asburiae]|uniref:tight adherence pilus pseudopilin TadF n=1 Tax=Scandinavium sp. UTDF21-P1B TaxID=3446379 RepID=UPI0034903606